MEKKHPLPWLNMLVSETFYLSHFLLFFSYFVVRASASQMLSPDITDRLFRREIQVILAFSVLIAIKMVKEETWEAFIADTLLFAKVFLLMVALIMDYHLALCYLVGFLVIFISTQQPAYQGLGNSNQLTPLQLEALLTEGNTSRFWLVEFRALCSSTSIRTSRIFPDLSITYSNKNLSFGIVDLGLFPNAAEKFGISLGGIAAELPTYILFDNAVEVARFPGIEFEAKASRPSITKKLLCRHFELDRHLVEYVHGK
ncbi:PREDICTED: thioredoxin-related transmembrane protein 2 isoform X3 [Nelumbo nucifera]|uniref:Thioredoxin-related transmembrane protein 2 isoform X3 n=1 Tax=Nelumbo nucifera TaxID=4432 RepID=A0A1U7ZDZ3_NELNU|nr:PREDICTED: thioredoxin-related transmembrane protein 2 isoform X3 [Nelumbo nucifera]